MFAQFGRLLVWVLTAVAVALAGQGLAQSALPPPMDADEIMVQTQTCAFIFKTSPALDVAKTRADWAKLTWDGPCRYGLAHGKGMFGEPQTLASLRGMNVSVESEAYYGRLLPGSVTRQADGRIERMVTANGASASMRSLGATYAPVWGPSADPGAGSQLTIYENNDFTAVATWSQTCQWYDQNKMTPEERLANKGCRSETQHRIYMIWVFTKNDTKGRHFYCPDVRSPVGCEGVWQGQVSSLIPRAQTIEAQSRMQAGEIRARVDGLMRDYESRLAAAESARRQAEANRIAEQRAAVERADEAFRQGLATKNAGELFALADEQRAAGDNDKARAALRALVSRYPDHPLAVTAAQQMSSMGSAGPQGGSGGAGTASYSTPGLARPNPPSAPPTTAGGSCANAEAEEERLGQQAYQSGQKFPGEVVRPMESLLWAVGGIIKMYESCPSHPNAAAKLQTYRKLYNDTMTTCGQMSSVGRCTARLH